MRGTRAKQLRREDPSRPHPGRLHGGQVGLNTQSTQESVGRKNRRTMMSRLKRLARGSGKVHEG